MSKAKESITRDQVLAGILKSIGANEPVGVYYQGYCMKELVGAWSEVGKVSALACMEYLGEALNELQDWSVEGFPSARRVFRFRLTKPVDENLEVELVICARHIS